MASKIVTYFFLLALCQEVLLSTNDNVIDTEVEDETINTIKDEILTEDNLKNIGGAISSFMQSDGGKQIGDMLMAGLKNGGGNAIMNQLLQGAANAMTQSNELGDPRRPQDQNEGMSPELLGNIFSLMLQSKTSGGKDGGLDVGSIAQLLMGFANQDSTASYMNTIMNIISTIVTSFVGPEAEKREAKHVDHAGMFPPLIEKLHVYIDHFVNSEMGAKLLESTGANKALRLFSDENGNFSYPKFVEMFENHSFRKHWISMATKRVAAFVSYFADPYTQKKFLTTFTLFINNFLKSQGVPKTALFDPLMPNESLTSIINHFTKKYLGQKVDAKKYVQPVVKYFQELLSIAEQKGLVGTGIDPEALSHKIADTINLEIIEPVVRVNRAYRFAVKKPQCDRYVMCVVNQLQPDEIANESIPGLKQSLSRFASVIVSWFISDHTTTSFWSLYHVIVEENNCQARFSDECNEFHVEEIKVTTEYVHNEL